MFLVRIRVRNSYSYFCSFAVSASACSLVGPTPCSLFGTLGRAPTSPGVHLSDEVKPVWVLRSRHPRNRIQVAQSRRTPPCVPTARFWVALPSAGLARRPATEPHAGL